ncbi:MAG: hypothetical protein K2Y04_09690 [Caulobacteraceae bacterium]|nr:hypothetical protein [Caulobacteraceae bacterium]
MDRRPLTLQLDAATLARVEAAAAAEGLSVEDWMARCIIDALPSPGVAEDAAPFDLADPRTEAAKLYQGEQALIALAEYDRTGVSYPLEDVLRDLRADLEARLASKA